MRFAIDQAKAEPLNFPGMVDLGPLWRHHDDIPNDQRLWVIEVRDLEHLVKIAQRYGDLIINRDGRGDWPNIPRITLYNSYME